MVTKADLQNYLKEQFRINKNISQSLNLAECEQILNLLEQEQSIAKLVEAYADKNSTLGANNATYARAKNQAERKLEALREEHEKLEQSIAILEASNKALGARKTFLGEERQQLEYQIQTLSLENQSLINNVQDLTAANDKLKKDNKDLKNIIDQIRLRLARDTQELLQYENSEIKKAVIRLFRWTLG